jgi:TIR domain
MVEQATFNGFFSYAHHDAEIDPSLIADFSSGLEGRVDSRLTNARFAIWRDREDLRTGERWDDKIEAELRRAHVLIVLLTPDGSNQIIAGRNILSLRISRAHVASGNT